MKKKTASHSLVMQFNLFIRSVGRSFFIFSSAYKYVDTVFACLVRLACLIMITFHVFDWSVMSAQSQR